MSIAAASVRDLPAAALYHPYNYIILQSLVIAITVAFTKPRSVLRFSAVVMVATLAWSYLSTCHHLVESRGIRALGASISCVQVAQSIDRLLLSRWSFDVGGPESLGKIKDGGHTITKGVQDQGNGSRGGLPKTSPWQRVPVMIDATLDTRGAGKPWEVKNVPRFSSKDPGYVPSRHAFLLQRIPYTLCLFLIVVLFEAQPPLPDTQHIFDQHKVSLFRRLGQVTADELIIRVAITICSWTIACCTVSVIAGSFAIICVGFGISQPGSWRPTFGSLTELYTIRKLWSVCWHQYFRATYEGFSNFFAQDILHVPKGSIASRSVKLFVPFLVSGLAHIGMDLGFEVPLREAGAFHYFCTQAFGIVLEELVKAIYGYATGRVPKDSDGLTPLWQRLIGFVWVVAFQSWSAPVWMYPTIRASRPRIDGLFAPTVLGPST
ncbi:MAG: hypothetical protein M1837_002917 [Sclerophora amabilis]|nr:MAG: hypothetical protein M1837_002917 [Sclerophora amabilis]